MYNMKYIELLNNNYYDSIIIGFTNNHRVDGFNNELMKNAHNHTCFNER